MSRVIDLVDTVVEESSLLPFDTEWAKTHIRAISGSEDQLIEAWIKAAAQYFEEITGHQIMLATREAWLDAFPCETRIELPRPPLRSVVSLVYVSGDGTVINFSDGASPEVLSWQAKTPSGVPARRGWIEPLSGLSWPIARIETGAVRIQYTCGYAETTEEVPPLIQAAVALLVGHFDQFRSEVHLSDRSSKVERLPFGSEQIMRGFIHSAKASQVLHCA